MLYYIILYYIMLCYVMLCYVILCYVMLCYVILYYILYTRIHVLMVHPKILDSPRISQTPGLTLQNDQVEVETLVCWVRHFPIYFPMGRTIHQTCGIYCVCFFLLSKSQIKNNWQGSVFDPFWLIPLLQTHGILRVNLRGFKRGHGMCHTTPEYLPTGSWVSRILASVLR